MITYYLDTNVLLRFHIKDNAQQFAEASQLLEKAKNGELHLILLPMIIFEIVFVLESYYEVPRSKICSIINSLLKAVYIDVVDRKRLLHAFALYKSKKVDIVDCYLYVTASSEDAEVFTFDKDFKKFA